MNQQEYKKIVDKAKTILGGTPATIEAKDVPSIGRDLTSADILGLYNSIDPMNFAAPGKKSQYNTGNDQEIDYDKYFVKESYHDGIYEQFNKDTAPAGWPDIQPTFKLNVSADEVRTVWKGTEYDAANANYGAAASAYNTASAVMPAKEAWPKYVDMGRGGDNSTQSGYNKAFEASTNTPTTPDPDDKTNT